MNALLLEKITKTRLQEEIKPAFKSSKIVEPHCAPLALADSSALGYPNRMKI